MYMITYMDRSNISVLSAQDATNKDDMAAPGPGLRNNKSNVKFAL
jgi:hypothetical protein